MTNDDVQQMSFEDSMKALEALVAQLEGGQLDLDQSLQVYERAIALRDRCRQILDESDRKVQTIMATAAGDQRADFKDVDG